MDTFVMHLAIYGCGIKRLIWRTFRIQFQFPTMLSLITLIAVLLVISGSVEARAANRRKPQKRIARLTDKQTQELSLKLSQLAQKVRLIQQQVHSAILPAPPSKGTQSPLDETTDLQAVYTNLDTEIGTLSTAVTQVVSNYNTLVTDNTTLTTVNTSLQDQVTTLTSQLTNLETLYNACIAQPS